MSEPLDSVSFWKREQLRNVGKKHTKCVCVWGGDDLQKLALFFHHLGPRDQTQVLGIGSCHSSLGVILTTSNLLHDLHLSNISLLYGV